MSEVDIAYQAGQFSAYFLLAWTIWFFVTQIKRIKKSKELGDWDKVKRLRWQILWLYPLGLVVISLLTYFIYDFFVS